MSKRKQYNLINAMRIIAAFFVVAIHVHFPDPFGRAVIALARFAVPFFFMVSGFFCYYEDESLLPGKLKNKIKNTALVTAASMLFYFVFNLAMNLGAGKAEEFIRDMFRIPQILSFIFVNQVFISTHLWYMMALLYAYAIFYFLAKRKIIDKCIPLIPVLLLLGIVGREVKELTLNIFPWNLILNSSALYRNYLTEGLPFLLLGYFIRKNEEAVCEKFSYPVLALIMLAGSAEALAVDILHTQKSIYLGTVAAVFALFILVIKLEDKVNVPKLSLIGAKYSGDVYIFHIAIWKITNSVLKLMNISGEYIDWLKPFFVFAVTLAFSAVYVKIKEAVLRRKDKKQCISNP